MKQYTNQEWLNIFSEVSSGNISAVRAMQKYNVSHSMYYKMKNKLASSNQEFQEAVILDQTNENDYIIIRYHFQPIFSIKQALKKRGKPHIY